MKKKDLEDTISILELQTYCNAQNKTIEVLQTERTKLLEEVAHLKALLETGTQIYEPADSVLFDTDEEATCRKQIKMLHDRSLARELTLEEARKLDIYVKIISGNKDAKKPLEMKLRNYSNEELTKVLNDETK